MTLLGKADLHCSGPCHAGNSPKDWMRGHAIWTNPVIEMPR